MTRKARYVPGFHLTDVPTYMTYFNVVSRDTVRIGFPMSDLNNLDVLDNDVHNAFLESPTKETISSMQRMNGRRIRTTFIVVRELYDLKYSSLQFRNFLAETLGNRFGYK